MTDVPLSAEALLALRARLFAKAFKEDFRHALPRGIDGYGIFFLLPGDEGAGGHVVAITSNPEAIIPALEAWIAGMTE